MNRFSKLLVLAFLMVFVYACANKKDQQFTEIKTLEEEVYSMKALDRAKGTQLIDAYVEFSTEYPADTASGEFLFKAAEIAMNLGMASQSLLYYDKVISNYPDYDKAPESLFLKAFIYENQLNDLVNAEKYYKEFIINNPEHPLRKDAEASLNYLGKTPEELIQIFQEKNK